MKGVEVTRDGYTHAGNPPSSHSEHMYGPGRTIACSPRVCAMAKKFTTSRIPVKSNFPGVGSCRFHGMYL